MSASDRRLDPARAVLDHVVAARAPWSALLEPGQTLRIVDLEGCQAVDTLFYAWPDTAERYDAQATLRHQGSAYLTTGTALMSNRGRVIARITADSCGSHDTSAGACSCEANTVRFGHHTRFMHACRENFVTELARYGMGKRDIVSNINFFMNVPVRPDGTLAIVDGVSRAGDHVDIRIDLPALCVISNCPQINNPCNGFDPTPIRVLIWDRGEA